MLSEHYHFGETEEQREARIRKEVEEEAEVDRRLGIPVVELSWGVKRDFSDLMNGDNERDMGSGDCELCRMPARKRTVDRETGCISGECCQEDAA